ncbi:MAG TPA: YcxB family protein [Myxococcales bacterium]
MVASGLAIAGTAAIIVAGRVGRRSRAPSFAAVREEGIELWRKGVAHVIGWQAIERVGDGVSLLMLKVDRKGWMGVPKRGFDPELSDEAVAEVRRRHEQGRTKDWPPLPAHEGEVRTSFRFERVEIDEVSRGMARAWLLRGRLLRRRPWRKGIWGVVLMVSALVGTASTAALGWIMLTVPFALILVFGFRATTAKGLSKQDKERQSTVSFEAAFDDRQFRYAWPGNRTSTDWEAVRGVWEGKTILLVWSNQMSYALPKRVLAAQDLERFRSLAARPVPNPS